MAHPVYIVYMWWENITIEPLGANPPHTLNSLLCFISVYSLHFQFFSRFFPFSYIWNWKQLREVNAIWNQIMPVPLKS